MDTRDNTNAVSRLRINTTLTPLTLAPPADGAPAPGRGGGGVRQARGGARLRGRGLLLLPRVCPEAEGQRSQHTVQW